MKTIEHVADVRFRGRRHLGRLKYTAPSVLRTPPVGRPFATVSPHLKLQYPKMVTLSMLKGPH